MPLTHGAAQHVTAIHHCASGRFFAEGLPQREFHDEKAMMRKGACSLAKHESIDMEEARAHI
jgi:hypothetical protein